MDPVLQDARWRPGCMCQDHLCGTVSWPHAPSFVTLLYTIVSASTYTIVFPSSYRMVSPSVYRTVSRSVHRMASASTVTLNCGGAGRLTVGRLGHSSIL